MVAAASERANAKRIQVFIVVSPWGRVAHDEAPCDAQESCTPSSTLPRCPAKRIREKRISWEEQNVGDVREVWGFERLGSWKLLPQWAAAAHHGGEVPLLG